nr:MAG TPA: hypothetical protein [Caudoviricetes sp.]
MQAHGNGEGNTKVLSFCIARHSLICMATCSSSWENATHLAHVLE